MTEPASMFRTDATSLMLRYDGDVDLIITDPPYSSLEKHRAIGTTTRLKNWFPVVQDTYFDDFMAACYKALKKGSHCYVFSDEDSMQKIRAAGERAGFRYWKAIVWDRRRIGMGYHYRAQHEFILFFEKGKRRLNDLGIGSVLRVKAPTKSQLGRDPYPTEKPVDLLKILVGQSSSPGETVVDPFCGSGATGEAAMRMGRGFVGSDISGAAIEIAFKRLSNIT